jgi:hypothetical protein
LPISPTGGLFPAARLGTRRHFILVFISGKFGKTLACSGGLATCLGVQGMAHFVSLQTKGPDACPIVAQSLPSFQLLKSL